MNEYLLGFIFVVLANIVMFVPAFLKQTDKLTDISYGVSFGLLALFAYARSERTLAHTLLLVAVLLWSVRIGGFLLMRIRVIGKDARFDGMRNNFFKFFRFWLLQGISVFVVMLGSLVAWNVDSTSLTLLSYAGLALFMAGLLTEAVADLEKFKFNQNPINKGKWIDEGLWRKSRHPNYLGEMSVWTGLFLFSLPFLSGWQIIIALISPLYIISLLSFVSGIPLLEKSADERWGKDENYQKYKKEVPVLFPSIKSLNR